MEKSEVPASKTAAVVKKIFRILLMILGSVFGLLLLILILIQFPFAQNILRKQIQSYVSEKIDTRFEIGKLHIGFPNDIAIENIYLEDRTGDTLLYGGMAGVNIKLFKLLKGEVILHTVDLKNITAKVNRSLPDTVFNFRYIIDAFSSGEPSDHEDTSSIIFSIQNIHFENIRAVYTDAITGNDAEILLKDFTTEFRKFDLHTMDFDIGKINIDGLNASVVQSKPLIENTSPDTSSGTAAIPIVNLRILNLKDIHLQYDNTVSDLHAKIHLGNLNLQSAKVHPEHLLIELQELEMKDSYAGIRMGNSASSAITEEKIEEMAEKEAEKGWKIVAGNIRINNHHLQFDDDKSPPVMNGMDYSHLEMKELDFQAEDLNFSTDSIYGKIEHAGFKEKSGLVLTKLKTDFAYGKTGAVLNNLHLETPGTLIQNKLEVHYPSLESIADDPGAIAMDIQLENTRIHVKDILIFLPEYSSQPVLNHPNTALELNTRLKGKVSDLNIENFRITGAGNTVMDVRGRIKGLPEVEKISGDLVIREISTTANDLYNFLPAGTIPDSITIPNHLLLTGRFKGSPAKANVDLNLDTDLGDLMLTGDLANLTDSIDATYDIALNLEALDLGTILQNDSVYGPATAKLFVTGKGYTFGKTDADFSGGIVSAVYQGYEYKDFEVKGRIEDRIAAVAMNMKDPNLDFFIRAYVDLRKEYPGLYIEGFIDSLRADALHLTDAPFFARTTLNGRFETVDPREPVGQMFITNSFIQTDGKNIGWDSIVVDAGKNDSGNYINVRGDFLTALITGKFHLLQLGDVIYDAIQPYFRVMTASQRDSIDDYNFRLNVLVKETPMLKEILPALTRLEDITLAAQFARNEGWEMDLKMPATVLGQTGIGNFSMHAGTGRDNVELTAFLEQFNSGSVKLYNTTLFGKAANNEADISLGIEDIKGKDRYKIAANIKTPEFSEYRISLTRDSLLLNYNEWDVPADNEIVFRDNDIHIRNLDLSFENQHLVLNSNAEPPGAPLKIDFKDFQIGTLTSFINPDTVLADGKINGEILVGDLLGHVTFTAGLDITGFSVMEDTVGNLNIKIESPNPYHFVAAIALSGRGNDLQITGNYTMIPEENPSFDLEVDIQKLPMKTVEALSMNYLTRTDGYADGKIKIKGHLSDPDVNGALNFHQAKFNLVMLGADFLAENESIEIGNEGLRFNNFKLRDSTGNILSVNGRIRTEDYAEFNLDLNIKADNFQAMNSTKKQNDLFYGRVFFDTDLTVEGNATSPHVTGSLRINENTDFTIVLPDSDPGVADREGIVKFVDMDSVKVDSTWQVAAFEEFNTTEFKGLELAVNIEVDKDALFNMIIDEGNGDFISMKGVAELSANIDQSGKVSLTGSYEIDEGEYRLSYNFIKRNFSIQKGSRIVWLGEPTQANVDLTAIYIAETAPLPLVEHQTTHTNLNYYKQRIPFNVILKLGGELLKPEVTFDITLPEDKNNADAQVITDVETKLARLRSEPSEMNKQVFAVLLLNRFVAENPFASGGDGLNAGTLARQSVSKILTQELNNLTASLISGVDINFDVDSREDYSTGRRENRTDLNMSLSKQLLNDRLRVTVGSNFNLEGPQQSQQKETNLAGNIAVDYMLSKDGRYLLRAYRENEYTGVIEGYVIETGLSFIISLDYEKFRDLFHRKKEKDKPNKSKKSQNEEMIKENIE